MDDNLFAFFRTRFRFLKKRTREIFNKLINDICLCIVFILVIKKWEGGGVTIEILKRGYLKL